MVVVIVVTLWLAALVAAVLSTQRPRDVAAVVLARPAAERLALTEPIRA